MSPPVNLIVSVDTEEDNWKPARDNITAENVRHLPAFQRQLDRRGLRATYFMTYQVAIDPQAGATMRGLAECAGSEIGAHLHPWNTPPIASALTPQSTMTSNLPRGQVAAKLCVLTDEILQRVSVRPRVFRAGRWGFNSGTASVLLEHGYVADSSVTPYKSWSRETGPSHIGAPLNPYRLGVGVDHRVPEPTGQLIEVPTSWGYEGSFWDVRAGLNRLLDRQAMGLHHLLPLAARLHLINTVVLSPEIEAFPSMLRLVRRLLQRGATQLHITFHSSTLLPGLNPFAMSQADVSRFHGRFWRIVDAIEHLVPVRFATVGQAASTLGTD